MKECIMRPHYASEEDWPDVEALLRASSLSIEGVRDQINQYVVVRDNAGLLGCAGVERYERRECFGRSWLRNEQGRQVLAS